MSRAMKKTGDRLLPPDGVLLGCVLALLSFSVLMVYSTSVSVAEVRYHDPLRIISHWLFYIPVGLCIMWGLSRIDVNWWRAVSLPVLGLGLALMVAVLIPGLGREINGAQRWFSMFGLTLQPVELLKPAVIVYMAYYMGSFPERLQQFSSGLAPMLVVLAISLGLLLLQPDFGSAVLLSAACFCMWFVGGVPIRHLALMIATFIPLGAMAVIFEPYRMQRMVTFLDPWQDQYGSGYQLIQSEIAFGSGGLFGAGIGQGVQKLFYLPEVFTDFISASIGEELGMVGMLLMLTVFAVLLSRGIWMAIIQEDMFARLIVLGCMMSIGVALLINLGAAMGMLPTKGMPLPFVSYGGSALIGECMLIGLVLSVQRHGSGNVRLQKRAAPREKPLAGGKDRARTATPAQQPEHDGLEHLF
ncbi:MAG: putative lipid II flippase FtsW [Zetaproteobacteria bacterium CG12_big_fil_rev_8_21_14_0_65_54_13]|nr:MAG: putative lipid II flippase FtsW [Zetaproteobacteria bacterium CG12_big_fil_rev_8_21_14_0_65_54_13]PIX54354.1 MAG: putative lipid II flippase FtsW [Zetaproteobacteria bacterium CG_4_10_14_3_um_filter_54_28]PJA28558.1 MAG: putative lipid II flippase FtsW [Zetaproteobacteria bacterium CG_4_9_14_3_um_filter_54_145]